ncbi:unnamed protein product, partial [Prorocentrum cordatum]
VHVLAADGRAQLASPAVGAYHKDKTPWTLPAEYCVTGPPTQTSDLVALLGKKVIVQSRNSTVTFTHTVVAVNVNDQLKVAPAAKDKETLDKEWLPAHL